MKRFSYIALIVLLFTVYAGAVSAAVVAVFGPEKFLRTTGKPNSYTYTFTGFEGEGKLVIINGDENGKRRISSAEIEINGFLVLGTSDFNQQVDRIEVPLTLKEDNSISVKLGSKPGSYLTIQLVQNDEEEEGVPNFNTLSSYPYALPISEPTDVLFTAIQTGSDLEPTELLVEEIDSFGNPIKVLGQLVDDGSANDAIANDFVYSGTFNISSNAEGFLYFRSKATFSELLYPIYSNPQKIAVTRFPTDIAPSDMSKIVTDPKTGGEFISNEVVVSFIEGTDPNTIQSIIDAIGGVVIGTIFDIGSYQIQIPDTGDASGVTAAIEALSSYSDVDFAEPNSIRYQQDTIPDDDDRDKQWYLNKIGAYEAWDFALGKTRVAIIDSGIDYDHEDLENRDVWGPDYVDSDGDPMDDSGHGTHVAGIIGAEPDNGVGIAGICWYCELMGIKANETAGQIAAGIAYAYSHGVKVINISSSGKDASKTEKRSVEKAHERSRVVVVSAGNDNCVDPAYPAAYKYAFAVGSTGKDDLKSIWEEGEPPCTEDSGSNYGEWVDIAAPGDSIYSTVPDSFFSSGYEYKNGTSMAAPVVSGISAVVRSQHPDWSERQVRYWLSLTSKWDRRYFNDKIGVGRVDFHEAVKDRDGDVCYYFKGEIKEVIDYDGISLPRDIKKKDNFRGIFCYDRDTDDSWDNYSDAGWYLHGSVPYGIFLTIDTSDNKKDLTFRTDPYFVVTVNDNMDIPGFSPYDQIIFYGQSKAKIRISFTDYSAETLDDDDLPSKIKLKKWDGKNVIIESGGCDGPCYGYRIEGKIKELDRLKF